MLWDNIKVYDVDFYLPLDYGRRTHMLCCLPNGILTLLISDPADTYIGCSLSVATGSHNDPQEIPGLAHLCEHMILTAGSREYPEPELYYDLISKYSGHHNAFTTGEQTTFYLELPNLDVKGDVIHEQVLEVFSSFFKKPLFQPVLTRKEIYAINSEHEGNVSSLVKIMYHCTRLLANKQHPFSSFSTGNIQSFGKTTNLHNTLSSYFREYFNPSRMTLCLRGPNSINALARIAVSKFGDISENPETGISRLIGDNFCNNGIWSSSPKTNIGEFRILENAWKNGYKGMTCFSRPIKEMESNVLAVESKNRKTMRLLFPICYKTSTLTRREIHFLSRIWSDLLGDESEGSVCHCLTEKGWITECNAYTSEFTFEDMALILQLTLTNSGWKNSYNICQYILTTVVSELLSIPAYKMGQFLEEQNRINHIKFLYQIPEKSPMDECSRMSCLLQESFKDIDPQYIFQDPPYTMSLGVIDVPNTPSNIPRDNQVLWTEQGTNFQNFIREFMGFENLRVILLGNQISKCPFLSKIKHEKLKIENDPYYKFNYWKLHVNFKQIGNKVYAGFFFKLPAKNVFIPEAYVGLQPIRESLKGMSADEKMDSFHPLLLKESDSLHPTLISQGPSHELWTMQGGQLDFLQRHKTILTLEISSKTMVSSVETTLHLEILAQIISNLVSKGLYPALKLGFAYELCGSQNGCPTFRISVVGFSDGILTVVRQIFQSLKQLKDKNESDKSLTKALFRMARVVVRSRYESAKSENSVKLASLGLLVSLERTIWNLNDRIEALEELSMESFKEFCHRFLDSGARYTTIFAQGNLEYVNELVRYLRIDLDQSRKDILHRQIGLDDKPLVTRCCSSTKVLAPGSNYFIRHSGNEDDPSNSIVYFIQTGKRRDKRISTLTMFTEYLFSSTLIPYLRNKRQIGYIVLGGTRLLTDTIGLHITVMSGSSPLDLEQRIEEYLACLEYYLKVTLCESTFKRDFLDKYLTVLKKGSRDGGQGIENERFINLMREVTSAVQHGDNETLRSRSMNQHRVFWDQICSRDFPLCKKETTKLVDPSIIERLTLKEYLQFFNSKLSIRSKIKSKLSVMICSPMPDTETASKRLFTTVESLLKMKGFVIESNELKRIIDESGGKPTTIMKEIFKVCHKQGDTWKFSAALLKEITSVVRSRLKGKLAFSATSPRSSCSVIGVGMLDEQLRNDYKTSVPLREITDLKAFKV